MTLRTEEIESWMVEYLAKVLQVGRDDIDVASPFERFGLDSATVVGMTGDLSDHFRVEVNPTMAYDYPTIETFAAAMVREHTVPAGTESNAIA